MPLAFWIFLRQEWRQEVSVRVHLYDSLNAASLMHNPEDLACVDYTVGDRLIYERINLHLYNHALRLGRGYDFDALIPLPERSTEAPRGSERSRSPARAMPSGAGSGLSGREGPPPAAAKPLALDSRTASLRRARKPPEEAPQMPAPPDLPSPPHLAYRVLHIFFLQRSLQDGPTWPPRWTNIAPRWAKVGPKKDDFWLMAASNGFRVPFSMRF